MSRMNAVSGTKFYLILRVAVLVPPPTPSTAFLLVRLSFWGIAGRLLSLSGVAS